MYQIIHSAKVVKCDETGEAGILVDGKVLPIGGSGGGGSNKIVIRNNPVWNEENQNWDFSFSSDVSYEDALRILMEDPTVAVLISVDVDGDDTYVSAENAYEVKHTKGNEYFGIRFKSLTLSWTIDGIEIMPE